MNKMNMAAALAFHSQDDMLEESPENSDLEHKETTRFSAKVGDNGSDASFDAAWPNEVSPWEEPQINPFHDVQDRPVPPNSSAAVQISYADWKASLPVIGPSGFTAPPSPPTPFRPRRPMKAADAIKNLAAMSAAARAAVPGNSRGKMPAKGAKGTAVSNFDFVKTEGEKGAARSPTPMSKSGQEVAKANLPSIRPVPNLFGPKDIIKPVAAKSDATSHSAVVQKKASPVLPKIKIHVIWLDADSSEILSLTSFIEIAAGPRTINDIVALLKQDVSDVQPYFGVGLIGSVDTGGVPMQMVLHNSVRVQKWLSEARRQDATSPTIFAYNKSRGSAVDDHIRAIRDKTFTTHAPYAPIDPPCPCGDVGRYRW